MIIISFDPAARHSIDALTHAVKHLANAVIDNTAALRELSQPGPPTFVIVAGQSIFFPGLQGEFDPMNNTYSGIPRDHAPEPYSLGPISIADSEGPVEKDFTESFTSDNDAVVAIDTAASQITFGTFGSAVLTRRVTIDGNEYVVGSATFNITPGALTVSGDITFPNLTPDA